MLSHKGQPRFPVIAVRLVEHYYWNDPGLAGLHEREDLKRFIERTKAAGEQRKRMRFLNEIQFAGEKIMEIDELPVSFNRQIGTLFKGQPDIQSKAHVPSRAALGRTHDSVAPAGNDHEIL